MERVWRYSASVSALSCQREKREEATIAAERRETKEEIVRRKCRSDGVGVCGEGWWVVKVARAVWREGDVSLVFVS